MKILELSEQELGEVHAVLKYHENAVAEGKADYESMCEDGDDTYLCEVFLKLIEQHKKFSDTLRKIIK